MSNDLYLYLACLDEIDQAVVVTNQHADPPDSEIVYVNRAFERLLGHSLDEVRGKSPWALLDEVVGQVALETLCAALESGGSVVKDTVERPGNGAAFPIQWSVQHYPADSDAPSHCIVVRQGLPEYRTSERQRVQIGAFAQIQRMLITGGHRLDELRQVVVEAAREAAGAVAAVVEQPDEDDLVYTAVCGRASASLGMRLPLDASISGMAYREKRTLVCDDVVEDNRVKLKQDALAIGFRSGVLAPLVFEGRCFGVLKVYHDEPMAFGEVDRLLVELAADVVGTSLGQAYQQESERRRQRTLVDSLPVLISYIDRHLVYQEVNAAYLDWFGLTTEQIVGHHVREVLGDEAHEQIRPFMEAALGGERVTFETEVSYARGGARPVEADYIPHTGPRGQVLGFYVLVRDLSDRRRAEVDYLTQTYNRRTFENYLRVAHASAERYERALSLIFIDLDHFKHLNDTHGHAAGDAALRHVAQLLCERIRSSDIVCRWGGEEFAILALETNERAAFDLAQQLRNTIRSKTLDPVGVVTASFGVGQLSVGESRDAFVSRIDRALYSAKAAGRDCVISSTGMEE